MRRLRSKLSYANVMVTILAFIVLGGGAAYAASHFGKNSVGSKQLKKNAVTTSKIKNEAVTPEKLKAASLTGANIQPGSLTGADINQGSLNSVRASNVTAIAITSDENCTPALPLPSGVTSQRLAVGVCKLTFPQAPSNCAVSATVHLRDLGKVLIIEEERTAQVFDFESDPKSLIVDTYNGTSLGSLPFDLVLVC
jgi:hypothetical protein